jgi:hypothetical protein
MILLSVLSFFHWLKLRAEWSRFQPHPADARLPRSMLEISTLEKTSSQVLHESYLPRLTMQQPLHG